MIYSEFVRADVRKCRCAGVQMCRCKNVQMCGSADVQMLNAFKSLTSAPLHIVYLCTSALLHAVDLTARPLSRTLGRLIMFARRVAG